MWLTCRIHVPFSFPILFLSVLSRNKPKSSNSSTKQEFMENLNWASRVCLRWEGMYHWQFIKYIILQSAEVKWFLISQSPDSSFILYLEDLKAFDPTRVIKWHFFSFEGPSYFINKESASLIDKVIYAKPCRGLFLELELEPSSSQSNNTVLSTKPAHIHVEKAEEDRGCREETP